MEKKVLILIILSLFLFSNCACYSKEQINKFISQTKLSKEIFKETLNCMKGLNYFQTVHKKTIADLFGFLARVHTDLTDDLDEESGFDIPLFISIHEHKEKFEQ